MDGQNGAFALEAEGQIMHVTNNVVNVRRITSGTNHIAQPGKKTPAAMGTWLKMDIIPGRKGASDIREEALDAEVRERRPASVLNDLHVE